MPSTVTPSGTAIMRQRTAWVVVGVTWVGYFLLLALDVSQTLQYIAPPTAWALWLWRAALPSGTVEVWQRRGGIAGGHGSCS